MPSREGVPWLEALETPAETTADFEVQKGTRQNRYPLKLEDLTKRPKRFLQEVYKDPITGEDFELIKNGGEIRGVRSTSKGD